MKSLLIEQRNSNGLIKAWRLRPQDGLTTFGRSKHADIITSMEGVRGIQGVFEFRENKWHFTNLAPVEKNPELSFDDETQIDFGSTYLKMIPLSDRPVIFSQVGAVSESRQQTDGPKERRQKYQLFSVYHTQQLLETSALPFGRPFVAKMDNAKTKIKCVESKEWSSTAVGNLEIKQRTIYLKSNAELLKLTKSQFFDDRGSWGLYGALIGCALVAFMVALAPTKESTVAEIQKQETYVKDVREITLKPQKPLVAAAAQKAPDAKPTKAIETPQKSAPAVSASAKAVSAIQSLGEMRISKLVGKISASSLRSKEGVTANGIVAGSGPSGRALSALGSIEKSGRDWSKEGKGGNIVISTNGVAGGRGVGSVSGLATGKTGTGGVGLLEDEGEIAGGLDREVIASYIKERLGEILYCYERQLSANPELFGKVSIKFEIEPTGAVDLQRIADTTLKSAPVEGCILQKIGKWRFPTPQGGTKVIVTYPFLFKSTN